MAGLYRKATSMFRKKNNKSRNTKKNNNQNNTNNNLNNNNTKKYKLITNNNKARIDYTPIEIPEYLDSSIKKQILITKVIPFMTNRVKYFGEDTKLKEAMMYVDQINKKTNHIDDPNNSKFMELIGSVNDLKRKTRRNNTNRNNNISKKEGCKEKKTKDDLLTAIFECINYLKTTFPNGEEGIFRLGGEKTVYEKLVNRVMCGRKLKFVAKQKLTAPNVTSALRSIFRDLFPDIIGTPLFDKIIEDELYKAKQQEQKEQQIATVLSTMGDLKKVLLPLMDYLYQITVNVDNTKMNGNNLGVVFAPTLFSKDSDFSKNADRIALLGFIIENWPEIKKQMSNQTNPFAV